MTGVLLQPVRLDKLGPWLHLGLAHTFAQDQRGMSGYQNRSIGIYCWTKWRCTAFKRSVRSTVGVTLGTADQTVALRRASARHARRGRGLVWQTQVLAPRAETVASPQQEARLSGPVYLPVPPGARGCRARVDCAWQVSTRRTKGARFARTAVRGRTR